MELFTFKNGSTNVYLDDQFQNLERITGGRRCFFLVDENLLRLHAQKFDGLDIIPLPAGEKFKTQATVDKAIDQLISLECDRSSLLIGVGGGVATDLTGYVASVYMRGIKFGFIPTTLLGIVDASIGGKNGVDVGHYKNMVGCINQPEFIFHDHHFLTTLPEEEWRNGMAEIIKHACILNNSLFSFLEEKRLEDFRNDPKLLSDLISLNLRLKMTVVQKDEAEAGDRKLLNFGHTLGHAIETLSDISHGRAISVGMILASALSVKLAGLSKTDQERISQIIQHYGLPVKTELALGRILELVKLDKKRRAENIDMILLQSIGKAKIETVAMKDLQHLLV